VNTLSAFDSWLVQLGGHLLSRGGRNASLLIMIYHRVLPRPDPLLPGEPDAATFAAQMDLLAGNFNVLPLREAARALRDGSLPPRAVCITFDDGYANNCEIAMPILRERKLPATVFVAPGFLNGGRMFNDTVIETVRAAPARWDLRAIGLDERELPDVPARMRAIGDIIGKLKYLAPDERVRKAEMLAQATRATLPTDLMMRDAQVVELLRGGIEIGAHTMHHPILASVDADTSRQEIFASKQRLEEITGKPITTFAYPNGRPLQDYDRTHVGLAREAGFELAVSTSWGAATRQSDPYQLPRVAPWDTSARRYALRMVNAYRQREYRVA
jgi:peptidoglycan/xylan/chitin deacetylase (PgdA/CDA1 family)